MPAIEMPGLSVPPESLKLPLETRVQAGAFTEMEPVATIPEALTEEPEAAEFSASMHGCPPDPALVVVVVEATSSPVEAAVTVTDGFELKMREIVSGTACCTLTWIATSELLSIPLTSWVVIWLSAQVLLVLFQHEVLVPVAPFTSASLAPSVAAVCAAACPCVVLLRQVLPLLLVW